MTQLLYTPVHSLIDQSLHARFGAETTNGDGFGLGWYDDTAVPGVFRSVEPAWHDQIQQRAPQTSRPLPDLTETIDLRPSCRRPVVPHQREAGTGCCLALVTVLPTQAACFGEVDVHHSFVADSGFPYEDRGGRRGV